MQAVVSVERKPKSRPEDREEVHDALLRLKELGELPIRACNRKGVCVALDTRLSNGRVFKALQSMHYNYNQVILARTGCSDGGVARGWYVDLLP